MKLIQGKLDYSKLWAMPDTYCFKGLQHHRKSSYVLLGMQQLQMQSRLSGKSEMPMMIVDEFFNPPPGVIP